MNTAASQSDTIDLANVARLVTHGWRWVVGATLLGVAIAGGILQWAPRRYTATATVLMRVSKDRGSSILSELSGIGDLGGALGGGLKGALETESRLMISRGAIAEAIDSLQLQTRILSPQGIASNRAIAGSTLNPAFGISKYTFAKDSSSAGGYHITADGFTGHLGNDGNAALPVGSVRFMEAAALPPQFVLEIRDHEDAIDRVLKHTAVGKPGGELLEVTYTADDSLTAARFANLLVQVYMQRRKVSDRGSNHQQVASLTAKLDSLSTELGASERALRREEEASGVIDPVTVGKLDLEAAGAMRTRLIELQVEEGGLKQLLDSIRTGAAKPSQLAAFPSFVKAQGVSGMVASLNELETDRIKLQETLQPTDSAVIALALAEKNIESQLVPFANSYLTATRNERQYVQRQLDTLQRAIETLPATAESALHLQNEVLYKSKIFATLQAQLVDARLAELVEGGDVKPLDPAQTPKKVSFPKLSIVLPAGIGGGLIFGVVIAVLVGSLGRWAQDPSDLERTTGVPALAFDPRAPLIVGATTTRTVLVAPLDARARAAPVAQRLAQTATARSVRATVLDLSAGSIATDVDAMIHRLEQEHELVIVQLPGLISDEAAASLRENRPVLIVTAERRVDRALLSGAIQMLRRMDVPCAGIVMSGGNGRMNGSGPTVPTPLPSLP
jgi:uncharacterized protein involved in exopolysaccharide biosynthesis